MDEDISFPHVPFTAKLSAFDVRWYMFYSRRILVFSTTAPKQDVVANVKQAVSLLTERCPALGGAMTKPEHAGPNGQKGWRKLGPGKGVRLVIKDHSGQLNFKSLEGDNFPPSKLRDDLLMPIPLGFAAETYQVLALQLNLIEGGALISFCIAHSLTDGTGMTAITDMLAECCRIGPKLSASAAKFPVIELDNSILTGARSTKLRWEDHPACRAIEAPPVPAIGMDKNDTSPQPIRIYRISEEKLGELKLAATRGRISTNDAIFAFMWRLLMQVRVGTGIVINDPSLKVHFVLAIGTRKFLGLEPSHIGNYAYLTTASLPLSTLLSPNGLVEAAAQIRGAINAVDKEAILGLARLVEDMPVVSLPDSAPYKRNQDVVVTPMSFFHAGEPLLGMDWGELLGHRAVRLRCPERGFWPTPGGYFVLPRMPEGRGCELQFQLTNEGYEILEKDPLFKTYLSN